jgi:DNA-binding transcriptional MerR regulator
MTSITHRRLDLLPDDLGEVGATGEIEPTLLVGDLAKATGKTVRAIHHYEELGLLKPHERSKGRYRIFTADSVVRVRWIAKLQHLGLSLGEIQSLARAREDSGSAMFAAAELRRVYEAKLRETRSKIRELRSLETELEESLEYLSGCDTSCMPELPTASCNHCDRHVGPTDAPDLVAGVHAH